MVTFIMAYNYISYYIIVTCYYHSIITYYYLNDSNGFSFTYHYYNTNNGFIITYFWPEQLGDVLILSCSKWFSSDLGSWSR